MKTCDVKWFFFLVELLQFAQGQNQKCNSTEQCECTNIIASKKYHIKCPPRSKIIEFTIEHTLVKMSCNKLHKYDGTYFPRDLPGVGEIETFHLKYCPLPNNSLGSLFQKYNINRVKSMRIIEMYGNMATKILFDGLPFLEKLHLNNRNMKLKENIFENLPNLTQLVLKISKKQVIWKNMFNYTPKLQRLILEDISYIPDGLFQNLPNLHTLNLWQNKLTRLDKYYFIGLSHLKILEIGRNKIEFLDKDTFSKLTDLANVSLASNKLHFVSSDIFKNNMALKDIRMGGNSNLSLSDYIFANLTNLVTVNLVDSNLTTLPEHIFDGSINILEMYLKKNKLKEFTTNVFKHLTKLNILDLEGNEIEKLTKELFISLEKLEILNLRNNRITTIDISAFTNLSKLTKLDLSYNQYSLSDSEPHPFKNCGEITELNISHNLISGFPKDIIVNNVKLKSLDLNNNNINYLRVASLISGTQNTVEIKLNNNNISEMDFREILHHTDSLTTNDNSTTNIYVSGNPIRCDDTNYNLIQYSKNKLNPKIKKLIDIKLDNLQCATPEGFKNVFVKNLDLYNISRPLKYCPEKCTCSFRIYDNYTVVNCSYSSITKAPEINLTDPIIKQIEVHLEGNGLESAPNRGLGYNNVTRLYLSNNQIKYISWIPPRIEILELNGNQIQFVNSEIVKFLNSSTTLQNLTLSGNPWRCDCTALELQSYLNSYSTKVKPTDVLCDDNKHLIYKNELIDCESIWKKVTAIAAVTAPILIVLFLLAVLVAMYLLYEEEIKIWLYANNVCLWFVTEEELDKDKMYDIFISYSHKDEEFVIEELLPVLESEPNPFKVCIHVRDWVPGEFITTQITNSVLNSRRTLVVLSDNFLESVWGKEEFKTAHSQAISDGRSRVIIVKYGKLNENKLDGALNTYLKTNTYLEWGDPWFWKKILYALPHSKKSTSKYKKRSNIMQNINDNFVTSSTTNYVDSIPSDVSLEPSLFIKHPVKSYQAAEDTAIS